MSYRRFDLAAALKIQVAPLATVATVATVSRAAHESVATVATVAALPTDPFEAAGRHDTVSFAPQAAPGSEQSPEVWGAEDWQAYFDERAAVREQDGRLARAEAERLAFKDAIKQWLVLNRVSPSDPRYGCAWCDATEQPFNVLMPVLTRGGHVWMHDQCRSAWHASRRSQAATALLRLGLPNVLGKHLPADP